MSALISGLGWGWGGELRRDDSYKYRKAVVEPVHTLPASRTVLQRLFSPRARIYLVQPWEDTFLLNGWRRAASQQSWRQLVGLLPAGRTRRVCRDFTAGRSLTIQPSWKKTGAWMRSLSIKLLKAIKVSPVHWVFTSPFDFQQTLKKWLKILWFLGYHDLEEFLNFLGNSVSRKVLIKKSASC